MLSIFVCDSSCDAKGRENRRSVPSMMGTRIGRGSTLAHGTAFCVVRASSACAGGITWENKQRHKSDGSTARMREFEQMTPRRQRFRERDLLVYFQSARSVSEFQGRSLRSPWRNKRTNAASINV